MPRSRSWGPPRYRAPEVGTTRQSLRDGHAEPRARGAPPSGGYRDSSASSNPRGSWFRALKPVLRAVVVVSRGLERRVSHFVPARAMRSAGAWLGVAIPERLRGWSPTSSDLYFQGPVLRSGGLRRCAGAHVMGLRSRTLVCSTDSTSDSA